MAVSPKRTLPGNPIKIRVFPNSGHHYYFAPIPVELLAEFPAVRLQCDSQKDGWQTVSQTPWVRFRFGKKRDRATDLLGVWLAVESNLGTCERGCLWEPFQPHGEPLLVAEGHDPLATPYAAAAHAHLRRPDAPQRIAVPLSATEKLEVAEIIWSEKANIESAPLSADLIVDFGNTRSVALILEENRRLTEFSQFCTPVRFVERGTDYARFVGGSSSDDPCVLVDSWVILHEPMFSEFEPGGKKFQPQVAPKIEDVETGWVFLKKLEKRETGQTKYVPQMFVELSPVLLGGGSGLDNARAVLRDIKLGSGSRVFMSSPKRYGWDNDMVGKGANIFWSMALNRWNGAYDNANASGLPNLSGQILRFMPPDGSNWKLDDPPIAWPPTARPHAHDQPTHPRSDSLTWVALAIIERAYQQINSEAYREQLASPFVPRKLRNILVTFPAGWTAAELECYEAKWRKAINIFAHAHLENFREAPGLITTLDEAVSSQLPLIYSEILRMPGGESWIELVGKGSGNQAHVRAMNIDIGGGTTDISIVDYVDTLPGASVHLEARTLFKNSSAVAGDLLVKKIIERALLPRLGEIVAAQMPAGRQKFAEFFAEPSRQFKDQAPAFKERLARIVRLAFIPIINQWMKEIVAGTYGDPHEPKNPHSDKHRAYSPVKIQADGRPAVDRAIVNEFNDLINLFLELKDDRKIVVLDYESPLEYDQEILNECISEVFQPLFQSLAKLLAAFDCDLLFVSGKPSELPRVKELLQREIPLPIERIVSTHLFPAGDWYPLGAGDGLIHDAKTATVVGAALYRAMQLSLVSGWLLDCVSDLGLTANNFWGNCRERDFESNAYLRPSDSEATARMLIDTPIGRKRYGSKQVQPDQVYKLRWKPSYNGPREIIAISVTLKRKNEPGKGEELELVSVVGSNRKGEAVTKADVELQVCSLPDEGFWMDSPRFEIRWPVTEEN